MSFWKNLFGSDNNLGNKGENVENESKSQHPLQSERTKKMQSLMESADGQTVKQTFVLKM